MFGLDSVLQVYDAIRARLEQADLAQFMEPVEHVLEVERLRQRYRPKTEVRVLVLAESHVRVSAQQYHRSGPAFLYNERYYTPWWQHLLLPAFAPERKRTDAAARLELLAQLQAAGVWVLDASLISLSGYRKVKTGWPNRPLEAARKKILEISWRGHVEEQVSGILKQTQIPAICVLRSVRKMLPEQVSSGCTILNFRCQSNAAVYGSGGYKFGTSAFLRAIRQAGLPC